MALSLWCSKSQKRHLKTQQQRRIYMYCFLSVSRRNFLLSSRQKEGENPSQIWIYKAAPLELGLTFRYHNYSGRAWHFDNNLLIGQCHALSGLTPCMLIYPRSFGIDCSANFRNYLTIIFTKKTLTFLMNVFHLFLRDHDSCIHFGLCSKVPLRIVKIGVLIFWISMFKSPLLSFCCFLLM